MRVRFDLRAHATPIEIETLDGHGALRSAHPHYRHIARAGRQRERKAPRANFRSPHVHLEGKAQAVMLQQTQMFNTRSRTDADMIASHDAAMHHKSRGAPGAI